MKYYAHYRKSDGRIFQGETWNAQEKNGLKPILHPDADSLIETDVLLDPSKHYIDGGSYADKIPMDCRYTASGLSLVFPNIPKEVEVFIEGKSMLHRGGELVIETDRPRKMLVIFLDTSKHIGCNLEVNIG